jgi:glutathione S-transferase
MYDLYHLWLSPACRKVRVCLGEKKLEFRMQFEPVWERRQQFLALNPAGEVPVLIEKTGNVIADGSAIVEYLDEVQPEPCLFGANPLQRAEVRRLVAWFDGKFNREVTENLVNEKITKRLFGQGEPDSKLIRAGLSNIHYHLDYITFLIDRRTWLAGDFCSAADITAAAHLSCIDYLGDVPWEDHQLAKDWYARVKSRPSFRAILKDTIQGIPPSKSYSNLDF